MCFSCHGKAGRIDRMPPTLAELRTVLQRDRRATDRRIGKRDTRVFQHDRRNGDRREGRKTDEGWLIIEEDMILEIEEIALSIRRNERASSQSELSEMTRIHDLAL